MKAHQLNPENRTSDARQEQAELLEAAERHARNTYPPSDWPHICEVATYAHTPALANRADDEMVILAAYFHDISSASLGPQDHNLRSAELALEWLSQRGYSKTRAKRVAAAIVAHMRPRPARNGILCQ